MILIPAPLIARTAESRPGPGPVTTTSRFFTPNSIASLAALSAATWAAKGVLLREPLKPQAPAVLQQRVLPARSVMVTMVLLKVAQTWATPSTTFFLVRLRARVPVAMIQKYLRLIV